MKRRLMWLAALGALAACDSGDAKCGDPEDPCQAGLDAGAGGEGGGGGDPDAGGAGSGGGQADAASGDAGNADAAVVGFPPSGTFLAALNLVEVSETFILKLQIEVESTAEATGGGTIQRFAVRAIKEDMTGTTLSEPFAEATNIPVAADGTFSVAFTTVTLPGAFSPTGSDVVFTVTFGATGSQADAFCGTITGRIETLDLPLEMSTFAAVPYAGAPAVPAASCDGEPGGITYDHLAPEDCPALAAGDNVDFPSAELSRSFRVFLPSNHDAARAWPVVFLWHGLGSSQDEMLEYTDFDSRVDDEGGFILVVPASMERSVEWDSIAVGENPDLVFFDDMLTCVDRSFNVDEDRVYTTGLSAGALWSTYLTMFRSEKIAAAAVFSGGLLVPYPAPAVKVPFLVSWGGVDDIAFDQNFDLLARTLMSNLVPGGHFVVRCDHGQEHVYEAEFVPWALRFLFDHPRGVTPEPYAGGLPQAFPDFCAVGAP